MYDQQGCSTSSSLQHQIWSEAELGSHPIFGNVGLFHIPKPIVGRFGAPNFGSSSGLTERRGSFQLLFVPNPYYYYLFLCQPIPESLK